MQVAYKVLPITQPDPAYGDLKETWIPILAVSLIIGHSQTKRIEAIVDSGARSCLFHASIGEAHGLRLKDGLEGPLGGVVGGSVG